jgi:hypothetical protein
MKSLRSVNVCNTLDKIIRRSVRKELNIYSVNSKTDEYTANTVILSR